MNASPEGRTLRNAKTLRLISGDVKGARVALAPGSSVLDAEGLRRHGPREGGSQRVGAVLLEQVGVSTSPIQSRGRRCDLREVRERGVADIQDLLALEISLARNGGDVRSAVRGRHGLGVRLRQPAVFRLLLAG